MTMPSDESRVEALRQQCMNEALYCFGTAYLFERRAEKYRNRLRLLAFLGIVVPLSVGGMYLAFSNRTNWLQITGLVAGVLGVAQLVLSAWSLTSKWEDTYSYSLESTADNQQLAHRFEELAKVPVSDVNQLETEYRLLQAQNTFRTQQDSKNSISEKEKRMGMRAGLRKYQRACAGCNQVPKSMKSTNCPVCGDFA